MTPNGRLTANADKFEAVSMHVQGMDIVAGVAEFRLVAAPLMHRGHRLHRFHGKRFPIEGPLVEAVERAAALDD